MIARLVMFCHARAQFNAHDQNTGKNPILDLRDAGPTRDLCVVSGPVLPVSRVKSDP